MQNEVPKGISTGPTIYTESAPKPAELQLTQVTRWSDIAEELTFFTPALLYLTTPGQENLLTTYKTDTGHDFELTLLRSMTRPIFQGLMHPNGDLSWNFELLGGPKEDIAKLHAWIGTAAFNDPRSGILRRIRFQEIEVRDDPVFNQITAANTLSVGSIPVTAWVIETNKGCFYFLPPQDGDIYRRPVAHFNNQLVFPDTVRFAEALKTDSPDPYGVQAQP